METPMIEPHKVPRLLSSLGIVPLALIAISPNDSFATLNLFGFLYMALIYCFLGGVHWGVCLEHEENSLYLISIVPTLFSIIAIYLYSRFTVLHITLWILFIIAFLWELLFDNRLIKQEVLPLWYKKVRTTSTVLLVVSATICAIRLKFLS